MLTNRRKPRHRQRGSFALVDCTCSAIFFKISHRTTRTHPPTQSVDSMQSLLYLWRNGLVLRQEKSKRKKVGWALARISRRRVGQGRAKFWWGCETNQSWFSTLWPSKPGCRDRSPTRIPVCLTHPTFCRSPSPSRQICPRAQTCHPHAGCRYAPPEPTGFRRHAGRLLLNRAPTIGQRI